MDEFIRHNNEIKALKLEYKNLLHEINTKFTESKRFFSADKKFKATLLLGRKYCALLFMLVEESLDTDQPIDLTDFDPLHIKTDSEITLWGMPIYVSMEDDCKIEIIFNLGQMSDEIDLYRRSDPDHGLYKKPLINIDELIDKLPDSKKFKRVENELKKEN